MSKLSTAEIEDVAPERRSSRLLQALPYLLILVLTLFGVAYVSINKQPLVYYWEAVAALTGVLCVVTGWKRTGKDGHVRLIWTQLLHWAAFLVAMNFLLYGDVGRMLNADSLGLATLLLLALGTFVAGVHALSWQTCVLGLVMALSVPAVAWIEESALILVLAAGAFIVLGGLFWWYGRGREPKVEDI